jgi:hypothetical protein
MDDDFGAMPDVKARAVGQAAGNSRAPSARFRAALCCADEIALNRGALCVMSEIGERRMGAYF